MAKMDALARVNGGDADYSAITPAVPVLLNTAVLEKVDSVVAPCEEALNATRHLYDEQEAAEKKLAAAVSAEKIAFGKVAHLLGSVFLFSKRIREGADALRAFDVAARDAVKDAIERQEADAAEKRASLGDC